MAKEEAEQVEVEEESEEEDEEERNCCPGWFAVAGLVSGLARQTPRGLGCPLNTGCLGRPARAFESASPLL